MEPQEPQISPWQKKAVKEKLEKGYWKARAAVRKETLYQQSKKSSPEKQKAYSDADRVNYNNLSNELDTHESLNKGMSAKEAGEAVQRGEINPMPISGDALSRYKSGNGPHWGRGRS